MADRLSQTFPPFLNYLKAFLVIRGLIRHRMDPIYLLACSSWLETGSWNLFWGANNISNWLIGLFVTIKSERRISQNSGG